MILEFHPEAEQEFLETVAYYERCETGLGEDFALEVHSAVESILSHPHAWPSLENDIRRCLTNRFPYGLLYSVEPDRIYLLAVMHLHRRPGYWKERK